MTPSFAPVRLEGEDRGVHDGDLRTLLIGFKPLQLRWLALHDRWLMGPALYQFRDVQKSGPFAVWEHTHRCIQENPGEQHSWLEDDLEFHLPLTVLSEPFARLAMQAQLQRLFLFRHWRTRFDLLRRNSRSRGKLILTGAGGLVGSQLRPFLSAQGFEVVTLVRREPRNASESRWDPYSGDCPVKALEGAQAVIHLSGHGVMDGRWDDRHRRKMWDSRVLTTRCLVETISKLKNPPEVLISASGVGIYPSGGPAEEEETPQGMGFLADLCRAWEGEARKVEGAGVRSVQLRLGAVLTPRGGALKEMYLPFWLGLGATIGGGRVPFSWISLEDVLGVFLHAIEAKALRGPVNAVAPEHLDFKEFADRLAGVLGRLRWLDVPSWAVRPFLGRKLDLLLEGAALQPGRLLSSGFQFLLPRVQEALRHELCLYGGRLPPEFETRWL